jgi:hypothetical protein
LSFNPILRSSAADLLKDPVFDSIRDPSKEEVAPRKIFLQIDQSDSFDYELCKADQNFGMEYLKEEIINEINLISLA